MPVNEDPIIQKEHMMKRDRLLFLNWVLLIIIIALFLFAPIMRVTEKTKESFTYQVGKFFDYFEGAEEEYTFGGAIHILMGKFVDVNEWDALKNEPGYAEHASSIGIRNAIVTVILAFALLFLVLCVITTITYVNTLINSKISYKARVQNGEAFCIFILILCGMSVPCLIIALILAVLDWQVILKQYEYECSQIEGKLNK